LQGIFLTLIARIEHTSSSAHELRLFLERLIICVHPKLLSLLRSSTLVLPTSHLFDHHGPR
jgi:hypothetical protein